MKRIALITSRQFGKTALMRAMADIYLSKLMEEEVKPSVSRTLHNKDSVIDYNGDFSGDIQISVDAKRVNVRTDDQDNPTAVTISVPFKDIRTLVLEYLLQKEIAKLQEYSYDEFESYLTGVWDDPKNNQQSH